jgi:hypothetical protein
MIFKMGDLIVAKMENLPPWPGRILMVDHKSRVYKVKLMVKRNPVFLSERNVESLINFATTFEINSEIESFD